MDMADLPSLALTLTVPVESGQSLVSDEAASDPQVAEAAFNDAVNSGRFVGLAGGVVVVVTPAEDSLGTPVTVEVWPAEPADDQSSWDHDVELDLDVPSGELSVDTVTERVGVGRSGRGAYRVRSVGPWLHVAR